MTVAITSTLAEMKLRLLLLVSFCLMPFSAFASASASAADGGYGVTSPELAGYSASEGGQAGTTLSGTVTQAREQPAAGRRAGRDRRTASRSPRRTTTAPYRFENVPPGQYHVGVRAEGYSTRRTEVTVGTHAGDTQHDDRFRSALRRSVVGEPHARPQFESYQPTSVLDGQELTKNLEATIGATLSEAPGVAMREFGPGRRGRSFAVSTAIASRCSKTASAWAICRASRAITAVPTNPAAARKIEVVRGPATLLYGANAIGGLVNVITDQIPIGADAGRVRQLHVRLRQQRRRGGRRRRHPCRQRQFALHFGGAGNRSGNYDTPEGEVDNSQSRMAMGTSALVDRREVTTSAPATATTIRSTASRSSRRA